MSAEYFRLWRASGGALKVNGEGALGTNGEGALGANGEGALKVNGEGALKVGGGALAGASMDAVRACRKGSVIFSSSDGGEDTSASPVSFPSPLPPSAFPSSSCSSFSGLSWRGWNMFAPLVRTDDSIIICMLK
jgi:hypothetical protein